MAITTTRPSGEIVPAQEPGKPPKSLGKIIISWITTTDHKVIGNLYFITSVAFFMFGGLLALIIRAELWAPGLNVVDNPEQFNQMFTMHGTIMLLLFATPLFAGFANALMPLQIGARGSTCLPTGCSCSVVSSRSAGSSPPAARPPSGGSPTSRWPARRTAPGSAVTCG